VGVLARVKRAGVKPDGLRSALREHTPRNGQGRKIDVRLHLCELDALEIDVLELDKAGAQQSRHVEVGERGSELVGVLAIPPDEREHTLILVHHSGKVLAHRHAASTGAGAVQLEYSEEFDLRVLATRRYGDVGVAIAAGGVVSDRLSREHPRPRPREPGVT
jgi:hypothetical protein